MVLIIVFIIFIGLMDLLAIITMIQEHRQNKKDYCRGFDDGTYLMRKAALILYPEYFNELGEPKLDMLPLDGQRSKDGKTNNQK